MQVLKNKKWIFVLVLITTGLYGCVGGELNVKVAPVDFQETKKLDMKVLLVIDDEFKNAKWVDEPDAAGWEAHVVHLGGNFVTNTENLAKTIFSNVVVVDSIEQATKAEGDVILKPSMISVKKNRPLWAWNDSTMIVVLEWSLTDQEKTPIWITSIKGEGSAGITDDKERLKLLVDDLFTKSYAEISSSPEINNYKPGS